MKNASDLRTVARTALKKKWGAAVGAGILASLLCGNPVSGGGSSSSSSSSSSTSSSYQGSGEQTNQFMNQIDPEVAALIVTIALAIVAFVLLLRLFVGCAVEVGYSRFNIKLIDGESPKVRTIFSGFKNWGSAFGANILRGLYTFLWTMLFIIPGIIATYSYAMTPYVLADNPGMSANKAITVSKQIMRGNRWRLFCLEFSFIGWYLLTALTLGIAGLWVNPYMNAARAAFYRELVPAAVPAAEPVAEVPVVDFAAPEKAAEEAAAPAVVEEAAAVAEEAPATAAEAVEEAQAAVEEAQAAVEEAQAAVEEAAAAVEEAAAE